jgi:hypothetical protein
MIESHYFITVIFIFSLYLFLFQHHCRRCGRCYCDKCCKTKVDLPRMCFVDPVRHCETCTEITKKENEFFDRHVNTLINGK